MPGPDRPRARPQPPSAVLRWLDAAARALFPGAFGAFLILAGTVPVGVPGLSAALILPCVFFWSVFRPAALPPPVVFGLGLMLDLVAFGPLGVGAVTLLLTHGVAVRWRGPLSRASFLLAWLAFCGLAAGTAGLGWALHALLAWQMPPSMPGLHLFGLAVGLYPALAWALTRIHTAMQAAEDSLP